MMSDPVAKSDSSTADDTLPDDRTDTDAPAGSPPSFRMLGDSPGVVCTDEGCVIPTSTGDDEPRESQG